MTASVIKTDGVELMSSPTSLQVYKTGPVSVDAPTLVEEKKRKASQ